MFQIPFTLPSQSYYRHVLEAIAVAGTANSLGYFITDEQKM